MRLGRGADDRKNAKQYMERAQRAIVLQAASQAWALGVPWAEAFKVADSAVARASAAPKPFPNVKAKAKAGAKVKAGAKPKAAPG